MRQALDRLAHRAWSNRKGTTEPALAPNSRPDTALSKGMPGTALDSQGMARLALNRTISSLVPSPRGPQAFLDPPSPAVIPLSNGRHAALASNIANRHTSNPNSRDIVAHNASAGEYAYGNAAGRRNSATSRDTSLTLRTSRSDASALAASTNRAGLAGASNDLVLKREETALMPSSTARESEIGSALQLPRAEHQLRQKVQRHLDCPVLVSAGGCLLCSACVRMCVCLVSHAACLSESVLVSVSVCDYYAIHHMPSA